jgi:hypothetical protein
VNEKAVAVARTADAVIAVDNSNYFELELLKPYL